MRVAGNVYWTRPSSNIGTLVGDITGSFSFMGIRERFRGQKDYARAGHDQAQSPRTGGAGEKRVWTEAVQERNARRL